jgi:hypothetical protein
MNAFLAPALYIALPVTIIWGWLRWRNSTRIRSALPPLSFVGFVLASVSAALAVLAVILAVFIGGFRYYDGRLLTIYALGVLLSFAGLVFALIGSWRTGPLRWHAPLCSLGTLLFWIISISHE